MIEQIAITTCEIDDDLEKALQIGTDWGIGNFEFRSVWGKRVPRFQEVETAKLHALIKEYDVKIVGISPSVFREEYCAGAVAEELKILDRSFALAESLDCRKIIVFSFRRSADQAADFILDEAVAVLGQAADRAQQRGLELVQQPMPQLQGYTSTNLLQLIEAVDHPNFNLNWDPANLCSGGEKSVFPDGYNMLKPYIRHIHLKNWQPAENWTTMEDGILNWEDIITALKRDGYDQYLSIETHHGPLVEKSKHNYDWLQRVITTL